MRGIDYLVFLSLFLVGFGGAVFFSIYSFKRNYIQKPFVDKWSSIRKKTVNGLVRWFFRLGAVMLIVYIAIPFGRDIPRLLSGNYETVEGHVTTGSSAYRRPHWYSAQTIAIDNKYKLRNYTWPKVDTGMRVTIMYLPYSKFVVRITE